VVQIDDSGSGSLIGGTCIGAVRTETLEYTYEFVPLEYYQGEIFKSKEYIKMAGKIVLMLLDKLNLRNDEELQICNGYMFDVAKKYLDTKKISYISAKIGDPLQTMIEKTFQNYALSLGLPPQYVKYTKYPLHFHKILRWVYADYAKRAPLCKTGWKSWSKYGRLKVSVEEDIIYADNYICLRCGMAIQKGTRVQRLEYTSNCSNIIYLHRRC